MKSGGELRHRRTLRAALRPFAGNGACQQQQHQQLDLGTQHHNRRRRHHYRSLDGKKVKVAPYSIIERRVPELIPVLGSQPAGDVSHKPGGRLPLLSDRPAVTPATLK